MDPFVGQLLLVGFNFPPQGWAFCQGQLLPLSQNTALFSLLGTYYGGDGRSTFGLPNLQGNVVMGQGNGPGLGSYSLGETGGTPTVTLLPTQMPQHSHTPQGFGGRAGDQSSPTAHALSDTAIGIYASGTPNISMSGGAIQPNGSSHAHNNMMPFLTLNWVIALQGVYPSRP
jgi:microcystin-dependent protein